MTKPKLMKCRYTHCRHPSDLKPPEEMKKGGGSVYYHPECYKERETINKIVSYYTENIDERVTIAQLRSVINNIIFKKGVSADELLFGIMYTHKSGKNINSPMGLHYIVSNRRIRHEYEKEKAEQTKFDADKVAVKEDVQFTVKPQHKGFENVF